MFMKMKSNPLTIILSQNIPPFYLLFITVVLNLFNVFSHCWIWLVNGSRDLALIGQTDSRRRPRPRAVCNSNLKFEFSLLIASNWYISFRIITSVNFVSYNVKNVEFRRNLWKDSRRSRAAVGARRHLRRVRRRHDGQVGCIGKNSNIWINVK